MGNKGLNLGFSYVHRAAELRVEQKILSNFAVADRQLLEMLDEHDVARNVIHLRISQPFPIRR